MKEQIVNGINYAKPQVILLQDTGIGTSEYAARTCYDSFESSENQSIRTTNECLESKDVQKIDTWNFDGINHINHSDLLDTLAWTHFHHSILEHANLTFLIKGTSRGVLQEHSRHRIQSLSVRSTRYTMSSVINAFVTSLYVSEPQVRTERSERWFINKLLEMDLFVTSDSEYNKIEIKNIFEKLHYQLLKVPSIDHFIEMSLSKQAQSNYRNIILQNNTDDIESLFIGLQNSKKKRNIGDAFKHIVTDNWKVDMVVTMNLRSLKNYFSLRDSGAAYFQIQWLAQEMKRVTPKKYLDLIVKKNAD